MVVLIKKYYENVQLKSHILFEAGYWKGFYIKAEV